MVPRSFSSSGTDIGRHSMLLNHGSMSALTLYASQTGNLLTSNVDKLCSAAQMDSSLSYIFLFPIPCDEPIHANVICQNTPKIRKYDTANCVPEQKADFYFGTMYIHDNSQTLVMSPITCPPQYNIYWTKTNTCIKLIHPSVSDDIYKTCAEQNPYSFKCFKEEIAAPDILVENAMNTVCQNDNDNATVWRETFNFEGCTEQNMFSIIHDTFGAVLHNFYVPKLSILHMVHHVRVHVQLDDCDYCMFHGSVGSKRVTDPLIACGVEPMLTAEHSIPETYDPFICQDGSFIAKAQVCDGIIDCSDKEDEAHCNDTCSRSGQTCFFSCVQPHCICDDQYYMCDGAGCLHYDKLCDGKPDCDMADDESDCLAGKTILSPDGYHFIDIPEDSFALKCKSGDQVYSERAICHYDTVGDKMIHCEDGTHLGSLGVCMDFACFQAFKCLHSYCIPIRKICDGVIDCPNQEDENKCEDYTCPGQL